MCIQYTVQYMQCNRLYEHSETLINLYLSALYWTLCLNGSFQCSVIYFTLNSMINLYEGTKKIFTRNTSISKDFDISCKIEGSCVNIVLMDHHYFILFQHGTN